MTGFLKRIAAISLLFSSHAAAQTVVVANFDRGFYIVPAAGGRTLYGAPDTTATWFNAQWNNPKDYSGYTPFSCPTGWTRCYQALSTNEWAKVYSIGGTRHIILGESGKNVACGIELDNLAAPINSKTHPGYPVAVLSTPNLGAIKKLYVHFAITPIYDGTGPGEPTCANALTKGSMLFAITLSSSRGQTLFYQLIIRTFNQPAFAPAFFANRNPFGYNDSMENYGGVRKGIPYSVATTFAQDVLPRLAAVITTASNGLDNKVSDWKVAAVYLGNLCYGNVSVTSDWSNVSVVSTP